MNFRGFLKHTITHWSRTSIDGYGKPSFSTPVTIYARWQDQQVFTGGASGVREVIFGSFVYTNTEVKVGDYLCLGTYTGLDPLLILNAKQVKTVSKSTDINANQTLYTALLKEK